MKVDKNKFLSIFKLELSYLVEDVSRLINYEKQLHEDNKHTNFVYLENLVVLKDEIMGLNGIMGNLENIFSDLDSDDYIDSFIEEVKSFVLQRGYPMAVFDLIKSKIYKVEDMQKLFK